MKFLATLRNSLICFALIAPRLALAQEAAAPPKPLMDYLDLDHRLIIQSLRAGNHDPSGDNNYYFVAKFFGIVNTEEESKKEFKDRKKSEFDSLQFNDVTIQALRYWEAEKDVKESLSLKISGDYIRKIIASTMLEHNVGEKEVSVQVNIELYEKNKRFYFFGEDVYLATVTYFPIPATKFDKPPRTNQSLTMQDDKGTLVTIGVDYKKPISAVKNQ